MHLQFNPFSCWWTFRVLSFFSVFLFVFRGGLFLVGGCLGSYYQCWDEILVQILVKKDSHFSGFITRVELLGLRVGV